jgi:hypothetical protein
MPMARPWRAVFIECGLQTGAQCQRPNNLPDKAFVKLNQEVKAYICRAMNWTTIGSINTSGILALKVENVQQI